LTTPTGREGGCTGNKLGPYSKTQGAEYPLFWGYLLLKGGKGKEGKKNVKRKNHGRRGNVLKKPTNFVG